MSALTRLQHAFLKRRLCAWCEAPIIGDACYAMYGKKCTPAEKVDRRSKALETYKPRKVEP